jgi:Kef-type K+ transport system membrane component KefB/nucleotide-binding universal stress UspA family protein
MTMAEVIRPLGGHAVLVLLLQIALLLFVARAGAELCRRLGFPVVIGELAAGLLLGPSVFGHFAPGAFHFFFPSDVTQFHLLEVVGTLGMVLLLLLTGLETDLRLLRGLGRAALVASASGMVLPFAMGFGLGMFTPDVYLAAPNQRILFSLFLATAMSISAMPVIAKILMDLDLTRRNIGVVILSAGVIEDTTGWLILSLIAGAVSSGSLKLIDLAKTLGLTAAFLVGSTIILYPLLRWLVRVSAQRARTPDTDMVLIMCVTLLCAAMTEWIGIHAVFGAFVVGVVLRQVPALRAESVHRIEGFVLAILGPVFFGIVGLKVNVWGLSDGRMLAVVLTVACLGKLLGCLLGGLLGGLRFWEASSLAVAMNARGAMELVVAMIGLSLGILNQQMFSIIVVVAMVTSFMAPLLLRLTMRRVHMTEDEARRLMMEETRGVFDPGRVEILVPTAGGPNALGAARLAFGVARRSANPVTVLFIAPAQRFVDRLRRLFRKDIAGRGIDEHLTALRAVGEGASAPAVQRRSGRDVAGMICEEASKGTDLIIIGASQRGPLLGGPVLEEVIEQAPCHVAIVRDASPDKPYSRLLVLFDGSAVSRVAAEFAVRYCEVTESQLTVAVLTERVHHSGQHVPVSFPDEAGKPTMRDMPSSPDATLERISPVFRPETVKPRVLHLPVDDFRDAMLKETRQGGYDLLVLGAENRAVRRRLFFGTDNERIIRQTDISVAILVPHIGKLTRGPEPPKRH